MEKCRNQNKKEKKMGRILAQHNRLVSPLKNTANSSNI